MNSEIHRKLWSMLCQKTGRRTLAVLLSFLVFTILFITMSIMGVTIFYMFRHGLLTELSEPTITGPIITLIISSCVVGTTLTALFSKIPLRPIRTVVDACNRVASGDFSVRLNNSAISEYNTFASSFNQMAEALSSVEMLRSDFVNNFSHEFKTPIVSLRGFAKLLKDPDLTEEERNEYLNIIISESDRLSKLATNVLTLTGLDSMNIRESMKPFDLTEQIRRSILLLESKWEGKDLDLAIVLDEIVFMGNEDLLGQVWLNLIDNAIKFSPLNGNLSIFLENKKDSIEFAVCDEGCGISEDDIKYIFDKFYQCDKSHSMEGNGLGLSIVHKIITLHGGVVQIQNRAEGGAVFSVTLPAAL